MSSREHVLSAIRANLPKLDRPLPEVPLLDRVDSVALLVAFRSSFERMGGIFLDPPVAGDALGPVRDKIAAAGVYARWCRNSPAIATSRSPGPPPRWPTSITRSCGLLLPWPKPDRCS